MPAVNSELILHAEFVDRDGAYIDPTEVRGRVLQPDGTLTAQFVFTKIGVGIYEYVFTPIQAGRHYWRAEGIGAAVAAEEKSFDVDDHRVVV